MIEETKERLIQEDPKSSEIIKPFLEGKDIKRYGALKNRKWLIFLLSGFTNSKTKNKPQEWLKKEYPSIYNWLSKFETKAKKRWDKGDYWWELRPCDYYREFEKAKIILPDISQIANFMYDDQNNYTINTTYIIPVDSIIVLGVLNSRLITWYYTQISPIFRGGYLRWIYQYLRNIPICNLSKSGEKISQLVEQMLTTQKKTPASQIRDR